MRRLGRGDSDLVIIGKSVARRRKMLWDDRTVLGRTGCRCGETQLVMPTSQRTSSI
jgi:hypothetical protein